MFITDERFIIIGDHHEEQSQHHPSKSKLEEKN
jgi:hypothetical protein